MADNSNLTGLYFEKNYGVFVITTNYPPNTTERFEKNLAASEYTPNNPPRLFWKYDFMSNPFHSTEFYYAEINHPTMGTAIFGARRNRGYVWQFDSEKDVKASLSWSLGEQYRQMLNDGYIVIKKGHNNITRD